MNTQLPYVTGPPAVGTNRIEDMPAADYQKRHEPFPLPDILRGVAVLGLLLVGIRTFGLTQAQVTELIRGPHGGNYGLLIATHMLADNTLPALFAVVFGAGMLGRMAFTNYLMQSIICSLFFFGYGFGYFGKLAFYQPYYVVGAVWLFQLVTSPIWLHYFRFGPFEWLWRSLTYWEAQPMRVRPV